MTPREHMAAALDAASDAIVLDYAGCNLRLKASAQGRAAGHAFRVLEIGEDRLRLAMAMGRAACERIAELEGLLGHAQNLATSEGQRANDYQRRVAELEKLVTYWRAEWDKSGARNDDLRRERDHWKERALLAEGRLRDVGR